MKLVKSFPFAIVLFILATGAIIIKPPKSKDTRSALSCKMNHVSMMKTRCAPARTQARMAQVLR